MNKEDATTLATFRIEYKTWKAFQEKAKGEGQNASGLLNRFIREYLDDVGNIASPNPLEARMEQLETRILALEAKSQQESKFSFLEKR